MRTKTLLLSAVALAAGLVAAQAQSNVYSANVVGYMGGFSTEIIGLTNGFNFVANQVHSDTTGTNDNVVTVFGTNLPVNTTVFAWSPSLNTFNNATWINSKGVFKWNGDTNDVNVALQIGGGVVIQPTAPATLTLVGNVVQGTNTVALQSFGSPTLNLVSPVAPISGGLQTSLGYVPAVGDTVFTWGPLEQTFTGTFNYIVSKGVPKWNPSEPQITPGSSFFIQTTNSSWINTFSVTN